MHRRRYLSTLVAAGGCGISGCVGSLSNLRQSSTDPEGISDKRFGLLEVSSGQWMAKEHFRYYDPDSESLKEHQPTNDWWYEFTLSFANLGDSPITTPDYDDISLVAGDSTFSALSELPEISWDQVRLREDYQLFWVDPSDYSLPKNIEGGDDTAVYFLFDAASDTSPLIKLEYQDETVYFEGQMIHAPTE